MPTTVISSIGSGKDYSTYNAWDSAKDYDLVAADEVQIGQMYNSEVAAGTFTMFGATTDAAHYRKIMAAPGLEYDPITDTGIKVSRTAGDYRTWIMSEEYGRMSNIGHAGRVEVGGFGQGNMTFENVWVETSNPSGSVGMDVDTINTFINVIVVSPVSTTAEGFDIVTASIGSKFYNCVAIGFKYGFSLGAATVAGTVFQNCAAVDNTTADWLNGATSSGAITNNLSSDATAIGTSAQLSESSADTFEDTAADDFHPKRGGAAVANGVDLSGTFTTDFALDTRSAPWDIGAYLVEPLPPLPPASLLGLRTTLPISGKLS